MNLLEIIRKHYNEVNRHMLLIGEKGIGKTTSMIKTIYDMQSEENIVTIYIPMYGFDNSEDYIKRYLLYNYLEMSPEYKDLEFHMMQLKKMLEVSRCKYYFFIDGIHENAFKESSNIYYEINELRSFPNVTMVVSCEYDTDRLKGFKKYNAQKINEKILLDKIPTYLLLNDKLKLLLRTPGHCWKYISLMHKDKSTVSNSSELLKLFYDEQIEKLIDGSTPVYQDGYYDYVKLVMNSFLPYVCTRLVEIKSLYFEESVCDKLFDRWKGRLTTSEKVIAEYSYSYVDVWKRYGILTENNRVYYINEQSRDFFAAKELVNLIEQDVNVLKYADDLYENGNVVMYAGELLKEYEFANKSDIYGPPSPIEQKLNNFRGIFDGCDDIVGKYIEIMKACRNNMITADYSGLNLSLTDFTDCDLKNSNFDGCAIAKTTFFSDSINTMIYGVLYRQNEAILYGGHGCIYIINTKNGISQKILAHSNGENIRVAALINNSNFCVTSTWKDVMVADLLGRKTEKKELKKGTHKKTVLHIEEAPDQKNFIMVSEDCASLWDSRKLKKIKTIHLDLDEDFIKFNVCFINDGNILYVDKSNKVMLYNLSTDKAEEYFLDFEEDSKIIAVVRDNYYGNIVIITQKKIYVYIEKYKQDSEQMLYDVYTNEYDFSKCEISGVDFYDSKLVISTDEETTILVWIEDGKSYMSYSNIYPICLYSFPKLLQEKILHIGRFGNCSTFNFDLKEEKQIKAPKMLFGEILECLDDKIYLIERNYIRIFDIKTLKCTKVLAFENVISGKVIKNINGTPYIIFSVLGVNEIFYYNCQLNVCKSWKCEMKYKVASSIDISEDGLTLLLVYGDKIETWDLTDIENPIVIKTLESSALKCALIGDYVLEHNEFTKEVRISNNKYSKTFASNVTAPIFNFTISNRFAKYYIEYDFFKKVVKCYTNNTADDFEPYIIEVEADTSVYKCDADAFCTMYEGNITFYSIDEAGKICSQPDKVFISEFRNMQLFHQQTLIKKTSNELLIYDGDTIKFYNCKGKRTKKQIKVMSNVNIYGSEFKNIKLSKEIKKIIKQNGGII